MSRSTLILSISALIATCFALTVSSTQLEPSQGLKPVAEIRPGLLVGYLPREAYPDSAKLSPPPPAEGSAALAADEEISRKNLALRDTARWQLAIQDTKLSFPQAAGTFSCALGIAVTEQDSPHLYMLLRRSLTDAAFSTSAAKDYYKRMRPFVVNQQPVCSPGGTKRVKKNAAYPSGHAAVGWAWALILSEISPEQTDAILARGRSFGQSRVVCNLHWQSDVAEGGVIGAAMVARLHADPVFRDALEAARAEVVSARAKGLKPDRDCEAEAKLAR
jgi:acid phosphatase (class A)